MKEQSDEFDLGPRTKIMLNFMIKKFRELTPPLRRLLYLCLTRACENDEHGCYAHWASEVFMYYQYTECIDELNEFSRKNYGISDWVIRECSKEYLEETKEFLESYFREHIREKELSSDMQEVEARGHHYLTDYVIDDCPIIDEPEMKGEEPCGGEERPNDGGGDEGQRLV